MEEKKSKSKINKSKSKDKKLDKKKKSTKNGKSIDKDNKAIKVDITHDESVAELNQMINEFPTKKVMKSKFPQTNPTFKDIKLTSISSPDVNPFPLVKCDGCYIGDAICFCTVCGKSFCKICDDQIHIIPSNRNHEKKPISTVASMQKTCYLHSSQPLKFFCETCEEPICHDCQIIGPHNNKIHKVVSIYDSYKKKFMYVNQLRNKNLKNKNQRMMELLQSLDNKANKIKEIKNTIEKSIRNEFNQMIEHLNNFEGEKLAIINYESSNLQKDLNKISEIIDYLNETGTDDNPDMINFLLQYKNLHEKIENILAKSIKFQRDHEINPSDFPHELEENEKKLRNYSNLENLIEFKDEIIWRLIMESKGEEVNEQTKSEIEKWAKLSDKYATELQKYNLVCKFCGCFLDGITVNTPCEKNITPLETANFGTDLPNNQRGGKNQKESIYGTKRHYFISNNSNI